MQAPRDSVVVATSMAIDYLERFCILTPKELAILRFISNVVLF